MGDSFVLIRLPCIVRGIKRGRWLFTGSTVLHRAVPAAHEALQPLASVTTKAQQALRDPLRHLPPKTGRHHKQLHTLRAATWRLGVFHFFEGFFEQR
jgi:hypothetical protein